MPTWMLVSRAMQEQFAEQ